MQCFTSLTIQFSIDQTTNQSSKQAGKQGSDQWINIRYALISQSINMSISRPKIVSFIYKKKYKIIVIHYRLQYKEAQKWSVRVAQFLKTNEN